MTVKELVQTIGPEMIELRHRVHRHPELSFQEVETTRLIKEELQKEGVKVLDYPIQTGVIGIIEGGQPGDTIAIRADIDALPVTEETGAPFASENPGVMHACGHDTHVATLVGIAKVANRLRDQMRGNLLVIFQPGEETARGAQVICKSGVFSDFDVKEMLGFHCFGQQEIGTVGVKYGQFMASAAELKIRVIGRGGHGAHPQKSIDPVVAGANIITALQALVSRETAPTDTLVISICKLSGGTAFNVIPDEITLEGTVRTMTLEMQNSIEEKLRRVITNVAAAFNAKVEIEYELKTPALICDNEIVERMRASFIESLGEENVQFIPVPSSGSEDFAQYSDYTRIASCKIGSRSEDPRSSLPNHNARTLQDDRCIPTGIEALAGYALGRLS